MLLLVSLVGVGVAGFLLWPSTHPSTTSPPPPPPPKPHVSEEIEGYRIEVVKCSLQRHDLICKLTITNLRGNAADNGVVGKGKGGINQGGRVLYASNTASVVFENGAKIEERFESKRFDDRTGFQLSAGAITAGVSMPKDQPIDLILQFVDVPDGVKIVKILNCGVSGSGIREIKLRDIEIEREADK
jgi:hypothetical protein